MAIEYGGRRRARLQRHADIAGEIVERAERDDGERNVGAGDRRDRSVDRAVAARRHQHARLFERRLLGFGDGLLDVFGRIDQVETNRVAALGETLLQGGARAVLVVLAGGGVHHHMDRAAGRQGSGHTQLATIIW
jgi:hypothetical protein